MKKQKFYPWLIMFIGILIMSGSWGLFINCIGVVFNAIKADLGFSDSQMALYYSVRSIVGSFAIGLTMKWFNGKKGHLWLAVYCAVFALSVGVMAFFGPSIWYWYASALFSGATNGIIFAAIPLILANWFRRFRGAVTGITLAFSGIFAVFMNPLISKMISASDWRNTCLILCGISLLLTVPLTVLFLRKDPAELGLEPFGEASANTAAVREDEDRVLPKSIFWFYLAYLILTSFPSGFTSVSTFFGASIGMDLAACAKLASYFMIGNLLSKVLVGFLKDRIGAFPTSYLTNAMVLIGALLFLFGQGNSGVIYAAGIPYGFAYALYTLQALMTMYIFGKKEYSWVTVRISRVTGIVSALLSYYPSLIYDTFGSYDPALISYVVCCVLQLILLFVIDRRLRRAVA